MSPPKEDLEWNEVGLRYSNGDKPKMGDLIRLFITSPSKFQRIFYLVVDVQPSRVCVISLKHKKRLYFHSKSGRYLIDYELVQRTEKT